ncbi:MAG: PQQ-binding-like beta-propeller repeat protein [Planctomycetes bacterium]|nr:PQQ-binding-like beta-propeller repeat protein [Planctomycetota bacterium]
MKSERIERRLLFTASVLLGAGILAAAAVSQNAGHWPMWGGSLERNMANPTETGMPAQWDVASGVNVKWSADLGTKAQGNLVVADGRILLGTNNYGPRDPEITGDKGVVMCFRESDGQFLWQAVHDKLPAGQVNDWPHEGICSSPFVDGNRAYYTSNRCELVCVDVEGFYDNENDGPFQDEPKTRPIDADFVWKLDMIKEMGVYPHNLAVCSPLVVDDLVFLITGNGVDETHNHIPSPRAPSFIAVDKNTGKLVWTDRSPGRNIFHGQWASPAYGVVKGKPQVIFPGGDGWVYAFEPKGDPQQPGKGKLIWKFNCNPKGAKYILGPKGTASEIIATPVVYDDKVYVGVGQDPEHSYGVGHLWCIDATLEGDVTEKGRVWHYGGDAPGKPGEFVFGRTISTVAIHGDLLFATELQGYLHCLDRKTGKPYWKHDMLAAVWGSPYVVDGKVYLGDEDGDLAILAADKEMKLLAENNMGNTVYSTPVATGGTLYIMTMNKLYALAQKP